jgi:hypothetical protein
MGQSKRLCLADLIIAAYDAAGGVTGDERATTVLAACAVRKMLLRAGRMDLARELAEQGN